MDCICFREVAIEGEEGNREKLVVMMGEYEKYKDLWGQNIEYSHSAGPSLNYSESDISTLCFLNILSQEKEFESASGAYIL